MPDVFTIIYQYAILNTMKPKDIETQARFWKQVNVISHATTNSCWEWLD